eukprot:gene44228-4940_t
MAGSPLVACKGCGAKLARTDYSITALRSHGLCRPCAEAKLKRAREEGAAASLDEWCCPAEQCDERTDARPRLYSAYDLPSLRKHELRPPTVPRSPPSPPLPTAATSAPPRLFAPPHMLSARIVVRLAGDAVRRSRVLAWWR